MPIVTTTVEEFNAAVKEQPGILDNKRISGKDLSSYESDRNDHVVLENLVINNLTLDDVEMRYARLRNVTFNNCTFKKVDLTYADFENVRFIGERMAGYREPKDSYADYKTSMTALLKGYVLFQGVEFGRSVKLDFTDGIVIFRNCSASSTATPESLEVLLGGKNLDIRIDNCNIENYWALNISEGKNTAYITNSTFILSNLIIDNSSVVWIENSKLSGELPNAEMMVVKNSLLVDVAINQGNRIFLVNNTYKSVVSTFDNIPRSVWLFSHKKKDNHMYIYSDDGATVIPGDFLLGGGHINIFNTQLSGTYCWRSDIQELNLSDVTLTGANWENSTIQQGKWNNVAIYPPFLLSDVKIGNIQGYNVEYPKGNPWKNGEVKIGYNHEPLEIERPPVPTLEELGLAQFWAEHDVIIEKEQ